MNFGKKRKRKHVKAVVTQMMLGTVVDGATAKLFLEAIHPVSASDAIASMVDGVIDGVLQIIPAEEEYDI